MKAVDWEDKRGRRFRYLLPDDADEQDAQMGILIGPPDVADALGLPEPLATRLHNILHEKGLWNVKEIRKRNGVLFGVLQTAYRVDQQILFQAYVEAETPTPTS